MGLSGSRRRLPQIAVVASSRKQKCPADLGEVDCLVRSDVCLCLSRWVSKSGAHYVYLKLPCARQYMFAQLGDVQAT